MSPHCWHEYRRVVYSVADENCFVFLLFAGIFFDYILNGNHPAALAVMRRFEGVPDTAEITELAGRGVKAVRGGRTVLAGNKKLMEENGIADVPRVESNDCAAVRKLLHCYAALYEYPLCGRAADTAEKA